MAVYIPCLNPDTDNGGSSSVSVGVGGVAGGENGLSPGVQITFRDSPFTLTISPFPPFLGIGINFQFWANLFGLGETRIQREKAQIQDVYTPIFQYLNSAFGVPIQDGHALQFPSDGVQAQFDAHPEIAALVPELLGTAGIVANDVFAIHDPSQGELERVVNQFLANAAINQWPVDATRQIWQGIVDAAQPDCSQNADRWIKNPLVVRSAAIGGALLQYIPLNVLSDMAVSHHIGDPLLENLILLWSSNPDLVATIPYQSNAFPWQSIYVNGEWALPPYGNAFSVTPLLSRDHIQALLQTVSIPVVRYPAFGPVPSGPLYPAPQPPADGGGQGGGTPFPQLPYPLPTGQPPIYGIPQPPGLPVLEIPPVQLPVPPPQAQPPLPPGQPVPQPARPPDASTDYHLWTQQQIDYACWISRLLHGNSPLKDDEHQWLSIPGNIAVLNTVLANPQCSQPIRRPDQHSDPIPVPQDCLEIPVQTPSIPPISQRPYYPDPPPEPFPQPGPLDQPCPPLCQYEIDVLRQRQDFCCDQTELVVLPKLDDLERFRDWVYHIFDVPTNDGPVFPPVVPTVPPVPDSDPTTTFPPPTSDGLPPITDCNSVFVTTLLDCIIPRLPLPTPGNTSFCDALLQCIEDHCVEVKERLRRCPDPVDQTSCEEGIAKWGKWAECWLNAKTDYPDPLVPDNPQPFSTQAMDNLWLGIQQGDTFPLNQFRADRASAMWRIIVFDQPVDVFTSPFPPTPPMTHIFEVV